jgi:hypothetical protein
MMRRVPFQQGIGGTGVNQQFLQEPHVELVDL